MIGAGQTFMGREFPQPGTVMGCLLRYKVGAEALVGCQMHDVIRRM